MSNGRFFDSAHNRLGAGLLAELDSKRGWYLALGVFLIILGVLASGMAVVTTLISVMALGWVLILAGAAMTVLSFLTGKWSGFLLTLAAGILSIIAGATILNSPVAGAVVVTLVISAVLIAAGLYRLAASMVMQFPNWGWSAFSGFVSLALGLMLASSWRTASLWFIGLYVGIDLIIHGFAWIMFSTRVHSVASQLQISEEDRRRAA
jgi:uncharacterized membrane protein HdeD (DUF308 family)